MDEKSVICSGHQELRDIVIETQSDVKHIIKALEKGDGQFEKQEERIRALEFCEEQRRGTLKFAGVVAGIISACGVVISILISLFWGKA